MKATKISMLIIASLLTILASAQVYQPALVYGKKENRLIVTNGLGMPRDTFALNDTGRLYPHLAYKNDTLRLWNPGLAKWINVKEGGAFDMDVFLVGGQSNARGLGDSSQSPNAQPGTVYKYDGTFQEADNEIITPYGPIPVGSRGSAWPSFGINYNRLTGRKVCIIPYGIDGSGQMAASNTGYGDWGGSGTLLPVSIAQVVAAMDAIKAAGYIPKFRGVLWNQGENDAAKINASVITSTQYRDTLTWMIGQYRNFFGSAMPFYILQTGTEIAASDVGYLAVRTAQQTVVDNDPLRNHMVSRLAYDYMIAGLRVDNIHINQTGLNDWGRTVAVSVVGGDEGKWSKFNGYLSYIQSNVGIGTRSPTHPLQVVGTGESAKFTSTGGGSNGLAIEQLGTGSSDGATLRFYINGTLKGQMVMGSPGNAFNPNGFSFHSFDGLMLLGSNNSDIDLFTGFSGPQVTNSKLKIKNNGQVGIGANVTPHASALVDMASVSKGLRIPTMSGAQMNAIATPATGLLVYCIDSLSVCQYDGSSWVKLGTGSGGGGGGGCTTCWDKAGNAGTSGFSTGSFLGTTNGTSLVLKSNGAIGAVLDSIQRMYTYGRTMVNGAADNTSFALNIKMVSDNGDNGGWRNESANGTAYLESGYNGIRGNIGMNLSASSGNIGLTTAGASMTINSSNTIVMTASAGISLGSTGTPIARVISSTTSLDFPSTAASSYSDLTVTLTGVAASDAVYIGVPTGAVLANVSYFAWVSSSNTITVRCINNDPLSAADPASGSFRVASMIF